MRNIVILTEKITVSRWLAPFVRAKWPEDRIIFLHSQSLGAYQYSLPRGLEWSDYPTIVEPSQLHRRERHHWASYTVDLAGAFKMLHAGPEQDMTEPPLAELAQADEIIYACDPDSRGAFGFYISLAGALGKDAALKSRPAIMLSSFTEPAIEQALNSVTCISPQHPLLEYGLAKAYFDFNWNLNALAIFGRTLRAAGIDQGRHNLSKYMLQMLYYFNRNDPLQEPAALKAMRYWKGSGRYKDGSGRLGSESSFGAIIDGLESAGLVQSSLLPVRSPFNRLIAISSLGRRLLGLIHPDCEDPDLPFRLEVWCEAGLAKSKPAMDRYIKTFFGKQKRFLEKAIKVQRQSAVVSS